MKKNKIAILLVAILVPVTLWLVQHNNKSTIKKELRDFAVEDTGGITQLFIVEKSGDKVKLDRMGKGQWQVNNKYPARQDGINLLLATIKNVQILSPVDKKAQESVIKTLASTARKIEIYAGDELIKVYYVGGETQDHLGTYMLLSDAKTELNSTVPFIMYIPGFNGYLTSRYFTAEKDWRDRNIFSYKANEITSVKVECFNRPEQSFEITGQNNQYNIQLLQDNKSLEGFDTLAIKQYLVYYENIGYESLENTFTKKDSVITSPPCNRITVTDSKGNKTSITMFLKPPPPERIDPDGMPLKHDPDRLFAVINGQDFVLIQYYVFGKLLPDPAVYFRQRPKL